MKRKKGDTVYSETIKGMRGNYDWPARFDFTDGFLGVTQFDETGTYKARVLLSPEQVKLLVGFVIELRR